MSREDLQAMMQQDRPELLALLEDYVQKSQELNDMQLGMLKQKLVGADIDSETRDGLSLLEVKNHLLLNYLLNLSFYFYMRLSGVEIDESEIDVHPVVESLVELRLFLEKLRPLEVKVRYQVDKLIKAAVMAETAPEIQHETQKIDSNDPLIYRANLRNFDVQDNESVLLSGKREEQEDGIYRPPRITPVHYDGDSMSKDARRKKRDEERQVHANAPSRAIIRELMTEMQDAPEEIRDAGNMYQQNDDSLHTQ